MLNWVILIAFHLYHSKDVVYTTKPKSDLTDAAKQLQIQTDCRELISHLYDTYVKWMVNADSKTLSDIFAKEQGYLERTTEEYSGKILIQTLQPLITGIQDFLCNSGQVVPRKVITQRGVSPLNRRSVLSSSPDDAPSQPNTLPTRPVYPAVTAASEQSRPITPTTKLANTKGVNAWLPTSIGMSHVPSDKPSSRPVSQSIAPQVQKYENLSENRPLRYSITGTGQQLPSLSLKAVSDDSSKPLTPRKNNGRQHQNLFNDKSTDQRPSTVSNSNLSEEEIQNVVDAARPRIEKAAAEAEAEAAAKAAAEAAAKAAAEKAIREAQLRETLEKNLSSVGNINSIPFTSLSFRDTGSRMNFNGGKPRTRKHNSAKPRTTTIRKRSKHPANQRKYTRRARRDRVSGLAKRTKRVKNNLG